MVYIHQDERKLYNALTDLLNDHLDQDFDSAEDALEYLTNQIGDWAHQWIEDSLQGADFIKRPGFPTRRIVAL